MENASKALLMAGAVLITMAVIGVAVYFFSLMGGYAGASEDMLSAAQIQSFNRFYTSYRAGGQIRVIDALNILNRAVEDDVNVELNSSMIKQNSAHTAYTVDSSTYFLKTVNYSLKYNPAGAVSSVTISD